MLSMAGQTSCGLLYQIVYMCIAERSLFIPCTMSAVSGHSLYYVRSLWSSPVLCLQSAVISTVRISGHLLYYVRSLWSSPVVHLQSL
ncbi:unnamed protein product, partial [Staurois parvus]